MKNYRLLAILLVLCMLASLTACMPSNINQTNPETSATTTVPTTSVTPTTTVPGPKTLHIKDYVTGIDTSKIDDDTIIALLRQAETILQEYDVVIIEDNYEIKHFALACCFDENAVHYDDKNTRINKPDCIITVYTNAIPAEQHEGIRYMIMAALLLQEYHDCYFNLDRYFYDKSSSDVYYGRAYISPVIREYAYDTEWEIFDALRYREISVEETGAYYIAFNVGKSRVIRLHPVWTPEYDAIDKNDLEQYYWNLVAKAFPEE